MESATAEIYPLSLHDALPILTRSSKSARSTTIETRSDSAMMRSRRFGFSAAQVARNCSRHADRKSTRLNSSHVKISYAVFCLKKKTHDSNRITARTADTYGWR